MTPVESQVAYFVSRMPNAVEYRCWWPHYKHRAEVLEKEWPSEYAGLLIALKEALKTELRSRPAGPPAN